MRPKPVWGWANAALAVVCTIGAVSEGGWQLPLGAAFALLTSASAFRSYIRVEDDVLFRRGIVRWQRPVDLQRLRSVTLIRMWSRELAPHLELWIHDQDGHAQGVSLRWWSNWRGLLALLMESPSVGPANASGRQQWLTDLDPKTRRRLQELLEPTTAGDPRPSG
jgi:hypothetical protein